MRKIGYLTLLFTVMFAINGFAQTQKGNVMVGAQLANIGGTFQSGGSTFDLTLKPKAGWFIRDNIAIGPEVTLGLKTGAGKTDFTYGVGAFGRYYVADKKVEIDKKARWFFEASAGVNGINTKAGDVSTNTNGLGLGIGPGLAYFITPNIGLEGLVKYDLAVGFGSSTTAHRVSFNLGFQIYMPSAKARQTIREVGK